MLHIHMFLFFQMLQQHTTMHEIGERLRQGLVSVEAMKSYVSKVRRAAYPFPEQFKEERTAIEAAWPAYALETALSRPPRRLLAG